ncbi:MAG: glycosyltransferase [Acidobacteriia bacterium]|nr:glycosyltransferase [Terriglobia bacterium]
MLAYWILVGLAIALALLSLRGDRARADFVAEALAHQPSPKELPPATVIVPIKGNDEGLEANLSALASLDYPDYELVIVALSETDVPAIVLPPKARLILAGDGDPATGEKINNLLAAVDAARPDSSIFAFADSDGLVQRGWLQALAAPLADPHVGLVTGYRWHLPTPPDFWSLLRSVWNSVIAGGFHGGNNAFAWGGAMAIRRETYHGARVPEFWRGAISDDFRIAAAIHAAGLRIAYAPGALVASTDHTTAGEFLDWIERQMIITRVYHPKLWWLGLFSHLIYCGAMAASVYVSFQGSTFAGEYVLVTQLGLGMLKGTNRASLAKAAMPAYETWFKRHGWVLTWWVPLATWFWLYSFLASARTNVISWRGNRYRVVRPAPLR